MIKLYDDRKFIIPDLSETARVYKTPEQISKIIEIAKLEKRIKVIKKEIKRLENDGKLKDTNKAYETYRSLVTRLITIL